MNPATVMLLLALGAPEPATDVQPDTPAVTAVRETIRSVDARLSLLEALRERSRAGDRVSLDAIRSASGVPTDAGETLVREQKAIEDLRDAIRVAETERKAKPLPAVEKPVIDPAPAVEKPVVARPDEIPDSPELRQRLAEIRYRDGDHANALRLYDAIVKAEGGTWASLRRARCLEKIGQVDDARKAYRAIIDEHPDDPWTKSASWSLAVLELRGDDEGSSR